MLLSAIVRPIKLLVFSPIVLLMSLYTGIIFGLIFLLFATIPAIFAPMYGFSKGVSGLCYLGLGIGMALGLVAFSKLSDNMRTSKPFSFSPPSLGFRSCSIPYRPGVY